jgi:hypothetical protein
VSGLSDVRGSSVKLGRKERIPASTKRMMAVHDETPRQRAR